MHTKPYLTLADARILAEGAEREAGKYGWAVTIAIVDDGGHALLQLRMDGAAPVTAEMAPAKARTAALGRRPSKLYEDLINNGRTSFLSAPGMAGMLEGGLPIVVDGHVVGAVGVSGVRSHEDAQVAQAAIDALLGVQQ